LQLQLSCSCRLRFASLACLIDGTVNFVTFREDIDQTPLLTGLPDDRCHARTGAMCSRASSEYLQFSPSDELGEVSSAILKNVEEMQPG
jgi:hypothetical protein